jgi:hypothetical protein
MADKVASYPAVKERITELLAEQEAQLAARSNYTREDILEGLLRNAKQHASPGASNKAYELLGMELGMFVKRSESRSGKLDPLEGASDEEILGFIAKGLEDIGWELDIDLLRNAVRRTPDESAQGLGPEGILAPLSEAETLQALSETAGVPSSGVDAPGTPADGGKPAGEKPRGGTGDSLPSDG